MFSFLCSLLGSIIRTVFHKRKNLIFTMLLLRKENEIYRRHLNLQNKKLHFRKVIGCSVSSRIDTNLLLIAFWHAVQLRNPSKGLIFHSDRESQYCSKRFRNALKSKKMLQSMSRKGDCWDTLVLNQF